MILATLMNRSAIFHRRDCAAAFTLIELLTVVVIIAVLAGLLLPVVGNIRTRADSTQCAANLRQIGAAIAGYANENDNTLPGPLTTDQLPTYSSSVTGSLLVYLAKYLGLPPATATSQTAPIFVCPAYAKVVRGLDQAVYKVGGIGSASPFGDALAGSQPMKLAALASLSDGSGKPATYGNSIALRDAVMEGATIVTQWVTWDSQHPVHHDHLNALYFDWHVGSVNTVTLQPK